MQLWIHNSTGAINAGDQQPGERLATPEEVEAIKNGPPLTPIKALSIIRELRKEKELNK